MGLSLSTVSLVILSFAVSDRKLVLISNLYVLCLFYFLERYGNFGIGKVYVKNWENTEQIQWIIQTHHQSLCKMETAETDRSKQGDTASQNIQYTAIAKTE